MTAREAALRVLLAGSDGAALDRILAHAQLSQRDRAFATELAHGTLKRRRTLAWSVETCLKTPFAKLDRALQWALLLGAYQILFLDRVPDHSAVAESVGLARAFGHAGHAAMANAVLRRLAREKPLPPKPPEDPDATALGLFASLPDWIAQALISRFGWPNAIEVAENVNLPPRRAVRVDLTKWPIEQASQALSAAGYEVSAGDLGVAECLVLRNTANGDRAFLAACIADGRLTLQSEESQFAVQLLDPKPGESVLDVCAGRGVKTGAIASRLHGKGRLVALDDDRVKLQVLEAAATHFATPVQAVRADARIAYPQSVLPEFDAVLVDAPCSALGIIGRRADVRWRKQPGDPERFARVQRTVLQHAAERVRPGGRLLYVTCSFAASEDEDVVHEFLAHRPSWRPHVPVPPPDAGIITANAGLLTELGRDGSDGFFYALLERRAR